MIEITENIVINANINHIWSFLIDFPKSLLCNRFHVSIDISNNYSLGKIKKFNIVHNFGFGNYNMVVEIIDIRPLVKISFIEYCIDNKNKGFPHEVEYKIKPEGDFGKLFYKVKGSYGGKMQDLSFKPILRGVMIEELHKLKKMIESSVTDPDSISHKSIKPI